MLAGKMSPPQEAIHANCEKTTSGVPFFATERLSSSLTSGPFGLFGIGISKFGESDFQVDLS